MFTLPREAILTRRDFVNTWECDENNHWNVQFYARAFEHAAGMAAALGGWEMPRTGIVRHVRYHKELRSAQGMSIHTARIADGGHAGSIVHLLTETETGSLAATALDSRADGRPIEGDLPQAPEAEIAAALPRGLAGGPGQPIDAQAPLAAGNAVVGHLGIVRRHETDSGDRLLCAAVVSRFTDSASHIWSHAGIGETWLNRTGHGRVAVEMKLTMLDGAREGDPLRMISWVDDMQEKTFAIAHQLEHVRDGRIAALGSVLALVMNLETRKAVALPAEMRDRFRG